MSTNTDSTVPLAIAGTRRPRSPGDCPDERPLQRGPWRYDRIVGCVTHRRGRCVECTTFIDHVEPVRDNRVYSQARDLADRTAILEAYERGWDDAGARTDELDEKLRACNRRIAELEADLDSTHASLLRTREALAVAEDHIEASRSHSRDRRGWNSGGGGRGRGGYRNYPNSTHNERGPRSTGHGRATTSHRGQSPPATTRDTREPTPLGPSEAVERLPPPTPEHNRTADEDNSADNLKPRSVDEVNAVMTALAGDPTPESVAAYEKARGWIVTANRAQAQKSATAAQFHLLRVWRIPEWVKLQKQQPTLDAGLEEWVRHYNAHRRGPLPKGVLRSPPNNDIEVATLRGHLTTVAILGHGAGRNHLRHQGQRLLAGIFINPQVYQAQLDIHGAVPAANLALTPLPFPTDHGSENPANDAVDRLDSTTLTTRLLVPHCANVGITTGMVTEYLARWARAYLGPRADTAGLAAPATGESTDNESDMGTPPTVEGPLPTEEADHDTEMMDATSVPLPFPEGEL
ncbi:hypothetical protein FOMPIDRAFT_91604 [Fomitopsis schrenkii]|uniref:Uncharacterized protein n=1 Tax=Fomitopsis schrenkii TaxID=2126942 RepID=S8E9W7_FOMSC|nr:hypothetical protein FOMPIDRAFT_91604 [Fomitopsis schrenkii]